MIHARLGLVWLLLVIVGWVVWYDPVPWRHYTLIAVGVAMTAISLVELIRVRRHGVQAIPIRFDLGGMVVCQAAIVLATGGLESPIIPAMIPLAGIVGFVADGRTTLAIVGGIQIPVIWAFAWLAHSDEIGPLVPQVWAHPGHTPTLNGAGIVMAALAMTVVFSAGSAIAHRGRTVARELLRQVLRARDATLKEHQARADEMTRLNAEIAHELKNPLATVKGLGALLARNLEGEAGERLAVLRREVDRMRDVLDDFLNFTRPLTPLTLRRVDVRDLVAEVCQLHEGVAAQGGVEIQLVAGPKVEADCDARKIRQVLINIVQNALEISPTASRVQLEVACPAGQVRIHVDDEGPGVAEPIRDRVFEAGVTDKARGFGLGLAIARGLIEQHQGELSLEPRPAGQPGTRARIQWPTIMAHPDSEAERAPS